MDQLVQCPVCTLFLHNGMSLESHLDTHPKDQVIKALCNFSKNSNYGSRTPTPLHSERSYRSRSRTPAEDSMRWSVSRSAEHDRYWRRTPSRTPKPNSSRVTTPTSEIRMPDINFDNTVNNLSQYGGSSFMKNDKTQPAFIQNSSIPEFDQPYVYYQDHQEDREIKYSRSAEYTALDSANNVFTYNMQSVAPGGMKLQTSLLPSVPRRSNDLVKLLPKPNNILVKANVGGVQYIAPGVKPMHMMVPTAPTFVQKNVQSNMIMSGGIPTSQMLENKPIAPPLNSSQYNQTSNSFTPGTTVVTQNSQIIYREMVHNIDGKPFISSMPAVLSGHENVTNMAQTSSMYQNVMVVDQFGNTSCMYSSPQSILPKPANTPVYNNNVSHGSSKIEKSVPNMTNDFNKTLVIEVGPIVPSVPVGTCEPLPKSSGSRTTGTNSPKVFTHSKRDKPTEKEGKNEAPGSTRGLKILSNIKVEVPVQHNKNMLNTILDLTGPNDGEYQERPISPGKILPDLEVNSKNDSSDDVVQSTSSEDKSSNLFSVIKNVGNPPSYKDSVKNLENKIDAEFSDSCPVPDLICNEKPSISPCSELSENGENSTDRTLLSPKPRAQTKQKTKKSSCKPSYSTATSSVKMEPKVRVSLPPRYSHPLRLNNLYVKKSKKVLQIKNAKNVTATATSTVSSTVTEPIASSSSCRSPENFTVTKLHHERSTEPSTLQTISIEKIKDNDIDDQDEFDADTEEQSMDIEPVPPSSLNSSQFSTSIDIVQVKEEINSSNESGFKNEPGTSDRHLTQLETLRPINVITYGNMSAGDFDDESNHRELLELEAASKSKQFVNMMNDNYFGDNIYADYFTPDRSFEERESSFNKEGPSPKEGMYLWGEPSQKESEFVLPNFIHESYKIAESNVEFGDMSASPAPGEGAEASEADGEGRDSKADVLSESRSEGEPPLDICADERMPPRGELSGQESNGDMESSWTGLYTDVPASEPYDLIARESWVSDGSEVDQTEKRDPLEDPLPASFSKSRLQCGVCGATCGSARELRTHRALHATAATKTSYSRMVTARTVIKKEEKLDEGALNAVAGSMLSLDSKEAITKSVFNVFDPDPVAEDKSKIERLIKQEPKRRRKDYVCPTCKVDQVTESAFHLHLKLHPLECLTCGKCFFRRANLALHIKTHLGIKNYKCEVCEKRFLTRQKLSEHHNVHTGRAPVKCTVCDDTFRRYSNMVQHRDRHHFQKKGKVRDFVCQCGAVFHSRAKLLWHRETHDQRPKACLYCSDKFVHTASLTRHVRRSHNEYYLSERAKATAENVPCPVCKQVYLRSNLRAHLLTHSGKRPYHCVVCNKSFTTKWNLKLHRWTHMSRSAKPYKCSLCKGAFIRQTEYIAHMNAHKSVRPYTCNYCGCQFIRKYNCQRHVREHEMAKKYVCKVPECGKSFHRSYYLSEHMKVHSGARPFSCSICGKTSSNKSNHNKHVKIHHAREPIATEA